MRLSLPFPPPHCHLVPRICCSFAVAICWAITAQRLNNQDRKREIFVVTTIANTSKECCDLSQCRCYDPNPNPTPESPLIPPCPNSSVFVNDSVCTSATPCCLDQSCSDASNLHCVCFRSALLVCTHHCGLCYDLNITLTGEKSHNLHTLQSTCALGDACDQYMLGDQVKACYRASSLQAGWISHFSSCYPSQARYNTVYGLCGTVLILMLLCELCCRCHKLPPVGSGHSSPSTQPVPIVELPQLPIEKPVHFHGLPVKDSRTVEKVGTAPQPATPSLSQPVAFLPSD